VCLKAALRRRIKTSLWLLLKKHSYKLEKLKPAKMASKKLRRNISQVNTSKKTHILPLKIYSPGQKSSTSDFPFNAWS